MASWASRRSNVLSSCENSPGEDWCGSTSGGLGRGSDITVGSRRRHWFGAAAENKCAAAALHAAPVNFGPESHKIVDCRHQRDTYHEPDREISNPVNRENVMAIHRPFLPAVVEDDGNDRNDLNHHFELTQLAGLDGETFGGGDGA